MRQYRMVARRALYAVDNTTLVEFSWALPACTRFFIGSWHSLSSSSVKLAQTPSEAASRLSSTAQSMRNQCQHKQFEMPNYNKRLIIIMSSKNQNMMASLSCRTDNSGSDLLLRLMLQQNVSRAFYLRAVTASWCPSQVGSRITVLRNLRYGENYASFFWRASFSLSIENFKAP